MQSGSPPVTAASVSVHLRPGLRSLQQLVEQLEEVAPGLQRLELDPGCRLASEPEMGLPVRACMAATLAGWRRWQLLLVLLHHCWLQGLKVLGTTDIKHAHHVLDKWVLDVRKKHIKTLRSLPPPAKS